MAKSSNQKLKILYILNYLMENTDEDHFVTMPDIITYLGSKDITAERKSVYDDIELLNRNGFDIIFVRGRGYHIGSRRFELAELKLLVDAVQSSKFITEKKSDSLIKKIEKLTSRYEGSRLQRQVYVSNRAKSDNETVLYSIDSIHEAIASGMKLTFVYNEWNIDKKLVPKNNGKPYVAEPKSLIWENGYYYLVAIDCNAGKIKHFRVDKMTSSNVTEEAAEHADEKFDVAQYVKEHFGMFSGEKKTVTVRFPDKLIGVVVDRFGRDVTVIRRDENSFAARFEVEISGQFFGWIVGLGVGVKIESPDDVAEEYKNYLTEITRSL